MLADKPTPGTCALAETDKKNSARKMIVRFM
jgi:hypothetical protein